MDSTTRTGGRTSRDFTVRGVRAQNARFERMRARQRARQLSWRSGWIVGTHSHVPSCANTSTGISAFMAATHLEARAARVHVRVKVFEELLAAFRQQCRRTLRHLCRGSSTRSLLLHGLGFALAPFSFFLEGSLGLSMGAPQRTFRFTPLGLAFRFFRFSNTHTAKESAIAHCQICGILESVSPETGRAAALLSVLTSHVCGWG